MLKICLVFWESEPQYAYKRYAYKKKHVYLLVSHDVFYLFRCLRKMKEDFTRQTEKKYDMKFDIS